MSKLIRLLKPSDLPTNLWDAESEVLRLPTFLASAYRSIIDNHNLQGLISSRDPKNPPVGGLTQERTDQHFAQAFDGSVARAQLAMLDPKGDVSATSNSYIKSCAGNRLSLTDAPCGAGAAALSFLANTAELRATGVLPREPLDVFFIGAELSKPAIEYAKELFVTIQPSLEEQAIFVSSEFMRWNVTDNLSNTDLIRKMTIQSEKCRSRLLLVANFNGLLERDGKRKDAEPQLSELFRHASGENSVVVWIEPNMNRATSNGGLFNWIREKLNEAWMYFAKELTDTNGAVETSFAKFYLPLTPEKNATVRLAVMPIDLVRAK